MIVSYCSCHWLTHLKSLEIPNLALFFLQLSSKVATTFHFSASFPRFPVWKHRGLTVLSHGETTFSPPVVVSPPAAGRLAVAGTPGPGRPRGQWDLGLWEQSATAVAQGWMAGAQRCGRYLGPGLGVFFFWRDIFFVIFVRCLVYETKSLLVKIAIEMVEFHIKDVGFP